MDGLSSDGVSDIRGSGGDAYEKFFPKECSTGRVIKIERICVEIGVLTKEGRLKISLLSLTCFQLVSWHPGEGFHPYEFLPRPFQEDNCIHP